MRLHKRLALVAAGLLVAGGLAAGAALTAPLAHANPHPGEVCDSNNFTLGLCMNAWNGYAVGHAVNMANSGLTNDGWVVKTNHRCNSSATVTDNCPFALGSGENLKWLGHQVVQIIGGPSSLCVADANANGVADQGHCNNSCGGFGGDTGTLYVVTGHVTGETGQRLLNVYWSGQAHADRYVQSPNAVGQGLIVDDVGAGANTAWDWDGSNGCP